MQYIGALPWPHSSRMCESRSLVEHHDDHNDHYDYENDRQDHQNDQDDHARPPSGHPATQETISRRPPGHHGQNASLSSCTLLADSKTRPTCLWNNGQHSSFRVRARVQSISSLEAKAMPNVGIDSGSCIFWRMRREPNKSWDIRIPACVPAKRASPKLTSSRYSQRTQVTTPQCYRRVIRISGG